ncbi:glycosyl transferase family 1, partial [Halorubrum sp. E3]
QYRVPTYRRLSTLPDLDVVHCHGPASTGLMGRRYAKKRGVTSVYTHHTPVEDYCVQGLKLQSLAGIAGRAYVAYENRFLQSFDCVTASTSRIRRNVTPRRLPVGIEADTFRPVADSRFASDEPTVGYSGRMTRKKHVGELLRLADRRPDLRFELVGEGPVRDDLERGAPANVQFRDFLPREDLPAFYSALDVFVTASTCDTLGLSTLEANA